MSSNDPPEGGPPRPTRRGGRNPAGQPQSATQATGYPFQPYPQTGQQQQSAPGGGSPSVPPAAYTGSFAVAPSGGPSGPQTPIGGSFPQGVVPYPGPQSTLSTGSQRSHPSPIGTPYQGSQITASELKSRGSGGTTYFGKNKEGQYLEVLYPSAFLAVLRENNIIHLQEPYKIYYKFQLDPSPPDVEAWAVMVKKLDREGRKVFFVHGTTKYGPAVIKKLFPGIDTRTNTFSKLYNEYNINLSQNLRRRIMWEDGFRLCLEWVRDFPDDFRVDASRWDPNPTNLDYTRHWIYEQMNEATYTRLWAAVSDVIPWANNFEDKNSLRFWFVKTITAGVLQKIGPIAAKEANMNPGVKWAKRGVKWVMASDDRNAAYDFLELQGTDRRFRNIEMETFHYATFADENTASTPSTMPKRRAEDLRAQNAFISESPPPSPPHKTPRHGSPGDPFAGDVPAGRESMFSSASRPRYASPLQQGQSTMPAFDPGRSRGQPIDPRLSGQDIRGSGRATFDTRSGSTPRATGPSGSSFESREVYEARLQAENRDYLARREAEIQEEARQKMAAEIERLSQQYAQTRSSQRPYQQAPSQGSYHTGEGRSPSLPPTTGPPPPSPQGIHHRSQGSGRSRQPSDDGSRLSATSSALSNLSLTGRPRSSGRGDTTARGDTTGRGDTGSRPSTSRQQLGSGLSSLRQRESAYPLTPLQMQAASAGVYPGTQAEQFGLSTGPSTARRTSGGGNFMAPTASSLTRSNSRRELRGGSAAAGPLTRSGSVRQSTRRTRPPVTLQQEQEIQRRQEDRERRRQAGERVDSPEPEIGRGYSTRSVSRSQTTREIMRADGIFQSRSQTLDTQETETMRADDGDDVNLDDEGSQSPSVKASNYLSLQRATYK